MKEFLFRHSDKLCILMMVSGLLFMYQCHRIIDKKPTIHYVIIPTQPREYKPYEGLKGFRFRKGVGLQ